MISIIIPTYNEAASITEYLASLQALRKNCEIIVVDGGSVDKTFYLAQPYADLVMLSPKGRALQMNRGAEQAKGDILVFLHADTVLPDKALDEIKHAIANGAKWGRFDIRLSGHHLMLPIIALLINWRSRLSGIATGDQVLFVTRSVFDQVTGFDNIALMEDVAICKKLKRISSPCCLFQKVTSSGRRWLSFGVGRTILLMWWLRFNYFCGRDPAYLALLYNKGKFWKP